MYSVHGGLSVTKCAKTYQITKCTFDYNVYFLFVHVLNKFFIFDYRIKLLVLKV